MPFVRTQVADRVATITLTDPDRRNALNLELVEEVVAAIDAAENDDAVGALVITGEPPAFCAGADLGALETADGGRIRQIYQAFLRVFRSPLPSVAALNGSTVGAGLNLALSCDVRVAAESAFIDTGFLKLNIHPGGGHTWLLQRELGLQATNALTMFGETLDGPAAERLGLVWRCVPDDEVVATAQALAARAATHPRTLLGHLQRTIVEVGTQTYDDAIETEYERQMWSVHQPEFRDALARVRSRISSQPAPSPDDGAQASA